jgi:hypothetical protein
VSSFFSTPCPFDPFPFVSTFHSSFTSCSDRHFTLEKYQGPSFGARPIRAVRVIQTSKPPYMKFQLYICKRVKKNFWSPDEYKFESTDALEVNFPAHTVLHGYSFSELIKRQLPHLTRIKCYWQVVDGYGIQIGHNDILRYDGYTITIPCQNARTTQILPSIFVYYKA